MINNKLYFDNEKIIIKKIFRYSLINENFYYDVCNNELFIIDNIKVNNYDEICNTLKNSFSTTN